jgi:hypothetical protein
LGAALDFLDAVASRSRGSIRALALTCLLAFVAHELGAERDLCLELVMGAAAEADALD